MKKLTLLIISIFFLVIFFGCDKSDVEPDSQRNQIDIRDSIVGEYYVQVNKRTFRSLSVVFGDSGSMSSQILDSVHLVIQKDTSNALLVECDELIDSYYPFLTSNNFEYIYQDSMLYNMLGIYSICKYSSNNREIYFEDFVSGNRSWTEVKITIEL